MPLKQRNQTEPNQSLNSDNLYFEILVSEFELESRYFVHLLTIILEKGPGPFFPVLWVIRTTTFLR